jgi:hypothetical protein
MGTLSPSHHLSQETSAAPGRHAAAKKFFLLGGQMFLEPFDIAASELDGETVADLAAGVAPDDDGPRKLWSAFDDGRLKEDKLLFGRIDELCFSGEDLAQGECFGGTE